MLGSLGQTRVIELSGSLAFGAVQVGGSATATLTISNPGESTLTWSGLSTGNNVFTPSALSGTVAAGGSATVTLTFTPAAVTSYSGTLTVTSDATSGTSTATVSGTGSATSVGETRILGLSGNLAFGNVDLGTSATTTLTLSNTGNSPLTWSGLSTGHPAFTASAASGTVAAGGSATVTLTLTPAAATSISSTLTVTSDATSGTNTATVSGTGITATRFIELSGNLDFGDVQVGTSATRTLTIRNIGNSTLTVSGMHSGHPVFTASPTSGIVAAGDTATVTVTFTLRILPAITPARS